MIKPTSAAVEAVRAGVDRARSEGRPVGILFVCLGNICRSPAAEGVMRSIATKAGMEKQLMLDSAGFYGGHRGELPDQRMRRAAARRGLALTHRSRTVRESDFENFDIIIGMDDANIDSLRHAAPTAEALDRIVRMSDFAVNHPDADCVPDPYWEGSDGFELVLDLLEDACEALRALLNVEF